MSFHDLSNEHIRDQLGNRIRKVRKSRRITQQQLAERAGLSRPTVSMLERGNDVSLDSFLSMLRALDLLDALDAAVAEPGTSPMVELTGRTQNIQPKSAEATGWSWGDEGTS